MVPPGTYSRKLMSGQKARRGSMARPAHIQGFGRLLKSQILYNIWVFEILQETLETQVGEPNGSYLQSFTLKLQSLHHFPLARIRKIADSLWKFYSLYCE